MLRVIVGLGNPGPEYALTRHNVGWWLLDLLQREWHFEPFRRSGNVLATEGHLEDIVVRLIKPMTYVNLSGRALVPLRNDPEFDVAKQLLVIVDDVALPVGKWRIRSEGSSGGHNGLKSIEAVLQTQQYPRLRIGVGQQPPGEDLADWVLSTFEEEDEKTVRSVVQQLPDVVRTWIFEGILSDD